ncbi:MAG TPA: hypothetical protein VIY69_12455 [Candidatus Acidoferrales bacterium]
MGFLVLILLAFQIQVGGPTQVQDPAYPLRVRIMQRNGSRNGYGSMRVWGRADIVDGTQEQGFDYESTCDVLFMVSHGDELYSARWKKPNKELEMLLSKMGTGKSDKCSVKADLKPFVYFRAQDGTIQTRPVDHAGSAPAQVPGH